MFCLMSEKGEAIRGRGKGKEEVGEVNKPGKVEGQSRRFNL